MVVAIGIISGLSILLSENTGYISYIGGVALILFGISTIQSRNNTITCSEAVRSQCGPLYAGFFTSVTNPYFWIWWITIGAAFLLDGLAGGIIWTAAFLSGHWIADLGWFTTVSCSMARGRKILSDRAYQIVLTICGGFLVIFGIFFITTGPAMH